MTLTLDRSRIIIWGGIIFAPAVTGWFNLLNKVPIQSKWPSALVKTGLDQFAFAPVALSGMSPVPSLISILFWLLVHPAAYAYFSSSSHHPISPLRTSTTSPSCSLTLLSLSF